MQIKEPKWILEKILIICYSLSEACGKVDRSPEDIKVIAVTKYVTDARVEQAIEVGADAF